VEPFPPWTWRLPERFNIGVACTDAHLATPVAERDAVVVDDDARGVGRLTYRALAERTTRFAGVLHALGVAPGDRVLIRLPNCLEYSVAFLGAMKRGAIPVPTSTLLTADEVEYLARDSGAVAMVTDRATWDALGAMLARQPALRDAPSSAPVTRAAGAWRARSRRASRRGAGDVPPQPRAPTTRRTWSTRPGRR
jgi:acyl-coenzyme A synthetase/AMP-(fatty) acid ligase